MQLLPRRGRFVANKAEEWHGTRGGAATGYLHTEVSGKARFHRDIGAGTRAATEDGRRADVRGAEAPGEAGRAALGFPAGTQWCAVELGGTQGAVARPEGQANRRACRGPSAGLRWLPGHDPGWRLWGRDGGDLGSRDVAAARRCGC